MFCLPRNNDLKDYAQMPILGPKLQDFSQWSKNQGYSQRTLQNQQYQIRCIIDFFQKEKIESFHELTNNVFKKARKYFHQHYPHMIGSIIRLEKFLIEA